MQPREDRPSYVRFERRAMEDRAQTIASGKYMTKDVDFAIVTPIGSKDEIELPASNWLLTLEQQVREERLPASHRDQYKGAYEAWKRGEETPLEGTPIKGWQVLSPAQQANVISANIRTVEDLARANGEAMARIGMGAVELKNKAQAWLDTARDVGQVATRLTALEASLASLKAENDALREENAVLRAQVPAETT